MCVPQSIKKKQQNQKKKRNIKKINKTKRQMNIFLKTTIPKRQRDISKTEFKKILNNEMYLPIVFTKLNYLCFCSS
jgi:hypothetical protein